MPWIVRQGAMSGGGFIQTMDFADDGTLVTTYDGGNCYIRNEADAQWENLFHQDRLPVDGEQEHWGCGVLGGGSQVKGINAPVLAICPTDSNYLYVVARARRQTGDASDEGAARIWRSTNKGLTWVDTGKFCALGTSTPTILRGMGPTMKVDPINPLHVICSDEAGVIWRTTDGFDTITCLMAPGEALEGVLPTATATGTTAAASATLTFGSGTIPVAVTTPPTGFARYASNVSDNTAMKVAMPVSSTTLTTVVCSQGLVGTGVAISDVIAFGKRACIAFDRSSDVVDDITQGIYIGWGYGATAIYRSEDGGETFSAMSGSPETANFIACSHDGVLYVLPYTGSSSATANHPERFVNSTGTGGLTPDTWTTLSTAFPATIGNNWHSIAADPLNAGRVSVIRSSGGIIVSNNYGTAAAYTAITNTPDANYNGVGYPRTSTDAPAMGPYVLPDGVSEPQGTVENSMTHGQSMWDPIVSGRLWFVEGIGAWYCSPPSSGTNVVVPLTGFNKNQQSVILNQMMKAPGGTLIATCQDRGGYRFLDTAVEPTGNFPLHTSGNGDQLLHCWGIDYAKNDPNFLVMGKTGGTYTSTNEGKSWTQITSTYGFQVGVACQSSTSFVIFGNNTVEANTTNTCPVYTTDGTTLSECSFEGNPIYFGWGGSLWNRHMVCADHVDSGTYYVYNFATTGSNPAGIYRSTDGGENWTKMRGVITGTYLGSPITMNTGANDFQLKAVYGHQGHLIIGPGSGYNAAFPMLWSGDAGVNWTQVPGCGITWAAATGKELPGADYPTLYQAGFNTSDADPTDPGIFMCTDFDPNDPTGDITWTRICRAPAGNMDPPRGMWADLETFGKFYMPTRGTGYVYGDFRQYGALR